MSFFKRKASKTKNLPGQEIFRSAIIEDFSSPDVIKKKDILRVSVQGVFSHLGWEMAEASAKVKDEEIILSIIGKAKSDMMFAQALKPYETIIEVKGLKTGKYKIKAEKGTNKEIILQVKE